MRLYDVGGKADIVKLVFLGTRTEGHGVSAQVRQAATRGRAAWGIIVVGVGLPRHDVEVEGVVVDDDAVLELSVRGRACYTQAHVPKRRCHHSVISVSQRWLRHD